MREVVEKSRATALQHEEDLRDTSTCPTEHRITST